ncbi:MAG: hypothetical protein IJT94_07605 [Oscillibacter sp.]|nr:hypothetical protein [Oscillibacter sp.]
MRRSDELWRKAWLALEVVLFFAIKAAELFLPPQPAKCIKFLAILCNTVMAVRLYLAYGRRAANQWDNLMALALAVNCAADVFLTLIGGEAVFLPGFGLFCTVELIYAVYLRPSRTNLAVRAALLVLILPLAWKLGLLSLTYVLGGWNLTLLAGNVVSAWLARRRDENRTALWFAAGLTLFLMGDISVALEIFLPAGTAAQTAATLMVWTVYVPAEALLVLTYDGRIRPAGKESAVRAVS